MSVGGFVLRHRAGFGQVRGPLGEEWRGTGLVPDMEVAWPPDCLLDGPAGPNLVAWWARPALESRWRPRVEGEPGHSGEARRGLEELGELRRLRCVTFWACGWD